MASVSATSRRCVVSRRVGNLQHLWHRQRCLTAWRALGVQRFDQEPGDKPGALWLSSGSRFFHFFGESYPSSTPHISALLRRPFEALLRRGPSTYCNNATQPWQQSLTMTSNGESDQLISVLN